MRGGELVTIVGLNDHHGDASAVLIVEGRIVAGVALTDCVFQPAADD
jgi:hypothetical protein